MELDNFTIDQFRFAGIVVQFLELSLTKLNDRIAEHLLLFIDQAQHKIHNGSLLSRILEAAYRHFARGFSLIFILPAGFGLLGLDTNLLICLPNSPRI
jgi:hypothetical protein